jgi:Rne/Rng family ribonuclease
VSGTLLLEVSPGEVWAALVVGGALHALRLWRDAPGAEPGEVYLGRVVARQPELPAALVDLGHERPAFLSAEDAPKGAVAALTEGTAVMVQVTKAARADKAAGVSLRLRLDGRFLALLPGRPGIDVEALPAPERARLSVALAALASPEEGLRALGGAAAASAAELGADLAALRARAAALEGARRASRPPAALEAPATPVRRALAAFAGAQPDAIVIDDAVAFGAARRWLAEHAPALAARLALHRGVTPLFEEQGIAGAVAEVLAPRVGLPGGGTLSIAHTAAATVIDVDSGSGGGRGRDAAQAALALNLEAARAVARQIRLRSLAGPIVIDFVGMRRREDRERVREALHEALAEDADSEVLGWTRLAHLEVVRKRRHAPLTELLFAPAGEGGLVKTPLTLALEALRALGRAALATPPRAPSLRVHPEVAAVLDRAARPARAALERRLGRAIAIHAEPGRLRERFDIGLA